MNKVDTDTPKRGGRLLVLTTIGWIILFSYLLLTSDPPDIGPIHLRSFEDQGHLFGSLLMGFLVFRVLERWTGRPPTAALLSLGATIAFLVGVEILQEVRPGRGYQEIDVQLNVAGASMGVALAWAVSSVRTRIKNRPANVGAENDPVPPG